MPPLVGFTDRSGFLDGPPHPNAPPEPARERPVTVVVTLLREQPRSLWVESDAGVRANLPLSRIAVDAGQGRRLRITLPAWLAAEKGLLATAGDGQGRLL